MGKEKPEILKELPGLDCGDCGFVTCDGMAEAIAGGKAELKDCAILSAGDLTVLQINEERVPLNRFVQQTMKEVMLGMLRPLKKADLQDGDIVSLKVRFKKEDRGQ